MAQSTGRRLLTGFVILAGLAGPAIAGPDTLSDERWQTVLKGQLKAERNCELRDVLTYSEMRLGNDIAISGRIACIDNREFDFNRPRLHVPFDIKLCEPAVC